MINQISSQSVGKKRRDCAHHTLSKPVCQTLACSGICLSASSKTQLFHSAAHTAMHISVGVIREQREEFPKPSDTIGSGPRDAALYAGCIEASFQVRKTKVDEDGHLQGSRLFP